MSDPTRWRDDPAGHTLGTEVLLRGARRPQAPGAHELHRLGAAVDAISRRPPPASVSWLRLAVAAVVAFAIVGGGTFVWALHTRNVKRLAAATMAEPVARDVAPARQPTLQPVAEAEPVRPPAAPAARPIRRHASEARVTPAAPAEAVPPNDMLAREVPLIDAGRSELATAPSRALAMLETHRREFPHGQLAAEREFLAVQALVQMNRVADAKKRALELSTRYPSSSYAARAARLIEDIEAQRAAAPARDGSRASTPPGPQRGNDRL
jgi:hypothetical protein